MTHIAPLLGDVKAIKMIVLLSAISVALVCTEITVTECVTRGRDKQLAVATMAAAVMVVHVVGAFFYAAVVVVRACLVLWVLTALVVGMLAVDTMQMAWLVELTILRRGLVITARVLVARATSFKVATIAIASRPAVASRPVTMLAMPRTTVVVLSAFQEPLELLPVMLVELMVKLALTSRTKLFVVLPLD